MPIEELFNHTCDIYHLRREDKSPGYGLPASPSFAYPAEADVAAVPCHFGVKGAALTIVQAQPQAMLEAKVKLTLPAGTDVRVNDQIVDCATGYAYTAEVPRDIRGHHITVLLHRSGRQEPL